MLETNKLVLHGILTVYDRDFGRKDGDFLLYLELQASLVIVWFYFCDLRMLFVNNNLLLIVFISTMSRNLNSRISNIINRIL